MTDEPSAINLDENTRVAASLDVKMFTGVRFAVDRISPDNPSSIADALYSDLFFFDSLGAQSVEVSLGTCHVFLEVVKAKRTVIKKHILRRIPKIRNAVVGDAAIPGSPGL